MAEFYFDLLFLVDENFNYVLLILAIFGSITIIIDYFNFQCIVWSLSCIHYVSFWF